MEGPDGFTRAALAALPPSVRVLVYPFAGLPPGLRELLRDPAFAGRWAVSGRSKRERRAAALVSDLVVNFVTAIFGEISD